MDQYLGKGDAIRRALKEAEGMPYEDQLGYAAKAIVDEDLDINRARMLVKLWRAENGGD